LGGRIRWKNGKIVKEIGKLIRMKVGENLMNKENGKERD